MYLDVFNVVWLVSLLAWLVFSVCFEVPEPRELLRRQLAAGHLQASAGGDPEDSASPSHLDEKLRKTWTWTSLFAVLYK